MAVEELLDEYKYKAYLEVGEVERCIRNQLHCLLREVLRYPLMA